MRRVLLSTAIALWGSTILADDQALLLGVERYANLDRVNGAADLADAESGLKAVGFDVKTQINGAGADMSRRLTAFVGDLGGAERVIVGMSGAFVTDGGRTWLLPVDATDPILFGLVGAVSLESVMRTMAATPGQSLLVLGADRSANDRYGPYMRDGIGTLDIPNGLTVITATADGAAELLQDLAEPGADVMALVRANSRLSAQGFVPDSLVLVPEDVTPVVAPAVPEPTENERAAETALWEGAQALDTADAYRNYLRRYPNGIYVEQADALILEITTQPNRAERLAEDALDLSRDARRDIQRDLALLNFDPRGIDGIFGPGSRAAVTNWQQENGFSQTSYLTLEQINQLDAQAARRAAELEAEAERARAEKEQLDRAFWAETGAQGDEPGLRAYLARFPDGSFASQATEQLSVIEEGKRQAAAAEDKTAWDNATEANTEASYRTYLQVFPAGAFVAEAEARIAALNAPAPANDAAIAAEDALGLDGITLRLIEARLSQLGLEPGKVDGGLDEDSRRAIRNFQEDRDLSVTGYIDEQTIVRLLADGFQALGRN
ncbi:peptidoglycan hydrolase-like protein with peptidoglycan-binding domain [Loktanella ponticola]|uniref:Peptidoglycan hydrolase-like protein with peptidoglycan-binding domain n=1 Tax=Yoonia ponticola TaxID=1524255 RepID=A0A7W9BIC5_9RHOB|nr:peptidoglycan-binding protein [Yoonia ponticola]MBB5721077.1 peptidoglycan hydrolase-like protein with peptidoglycan-binding domain [Yoonia ponticola]